MPHTYPCPITRAALLLAMQGRNPITFEIDDVRYSGDF